MIRILGALGLASVLLLGSAAMGSYVSMRGTADVPDCCKKKESCCPKSSCCPKGEHSPAGQCMLPKA